MAGEFSSHRGVGPVILLARFKGVLFKFLDFLFQCTVGEIEIGPLLVDGHLSEVVCRP